MLPVARTSETSVYVEHLAADLYYVSPGQINFLVPPDAAARPSLGLGRDERRAWSDDSIDAGEGGPRPFQLYLPKDSFNTHRYAADGSVTYAGVARQTRRYRRSLGYRTRSQLTPPAIYGQLPTAAAPLVPGANLSILLDGTPWTRAPSSMRASRRALPGSIRLI